MTNTVHHHTFHLPFSLCIPGKSEPRALCESCHIDIACRQGQFAFSHIWTWTLLARSVLESTLWPMLKPTPVSPVSPATDRHRHTGTGHHRMTHASLSVIGDVTTEPLSEDLSALPLASLGLVLDIWMLEPGCPGPPTAQRRRRKKTIRATCHFAEDTWYHPITPHLSAGGKALAEPSRYSCPHIHLCLQGHG